MASRLAPSPSAAKERASKKARVDDEAGGSTLASSAKSPTGNGHATSLLPPDSLLEVFLFLDVGDVPTIVRVCKFFAERLSSTGSSKFWLGLVRRHYPMVEKTTNLLPATVGDEPDAVSVLGKNLTIPAPSRNWRCQFRRAHVLKRRLRENGGRGYGGDPRKARHISLSAEETDKLPPLSDYYFQVDIRLLDKHDHEIGFISRILDNAEYKLAAGLTSRICLPMDNLEELAHYEFDGIKTEIVVYQRSTGKQAFLFDSGADEDHVIKRFEPNWFYFDEFRTTYKVDDERLSCVVYAHKTGCPSKGNLDRSYRLSVSPTVFSNFFSKPHLCESWPASIQCTCPEKWSCFWQMDFQLLFPWGDGDEIGDDLGQLLDLFNKLDYL